MFVYNFKKGKIGETYNIGTNNELENIKICKMICLKINKLKKNKFNNLKLIKFVDDRKGHDLRYAINNNKIKKHLVLDQNINLKTHWTLQ